LLSEPPNKNCATVAEVVPETNQPQFHPLLTARAWDETALNHPRIARRQVLPSGGDGGLIFEGTGFEKQGRPAVGVARQSTGTAGKVPTGPGTVNGQYAERPLAWPVATRLYLPREGAEEPERRQPAHVPAALGFQTQAEIALALRDEATAGGGRHAGVPCDADYGDNPPFLNGLEARGERPVVAVRANFSVTLGRGPTSPGLRAAAMRAAQPLPAGQPSAWSAGAKGWWRAKGLALRGGRGDGDGTGHGGGLIGQRPGRGQQGGWQYFWRDCPAPPWPCWWRRPSAATGSSTIMKKRKPTWAGLRIRAGAGRAFLGTRSR
jgi:hypothetical protein